jgi:hypothetical protein
MKILGSNIILIFVLLAASTFAQSKNNRLGRMKQDQYEKINFEGLMRRYLVKQPSVSSKSIEGIYNVSCIITKRSKGILSGDEKEKAVERKDNYAKVAILKDNLGTSREYIEVSLDSKFTTHFPIVGEFNSLSEGNGFIYKHIEPNGDVSSFTFANEENDILEGVMSEMQGRKTITYKMTYLKVFPKGGSEQITSNQ